MSIVLEVDHLVKDYRSKRAVNDISFQVEEGEVFGLIGPNGAGKSTTIECILGTKKKTSGTIEILGAVNPIPKTSAYADLIKGIGVQFQKSFFLERIRVNEMCEMISALYDDVVPYEMYLDMFGLGDKGAYEVSKMSGGEQQKLSLVLALLHKPKLVFLDELTTGLDPGARREVWEILRKLQNQGLTIILTSHYMDEVMKLCSRIMVINHGEMLYTGTIEEALSWTGTDNLEDAYLKIVGEEAANETVMGIV